MAKHIFKTENLFDTVEVGEHEFTLLMNDEKIKEFRLLIADYGEKFAEISAIDTEGISEEEAEKIEGQAKDLLETVIDSILEPGAYKKIYEALGRSTINVGGFTVYLFELIGEKHEEANLNRSTAYTKKAGGKKLSANFMK